MTTSLQFADFSNNNTEPDWRKLAAEGIVGVHLKVTEALGFVDPTFMPWAMRARAAGLRVGGYHFFHPNLDPVAQADFFIAHLGLIGPHDLKPALDCEETGGCTPRTIELNCRLWNHEVVRKTHVGPLFYSYTSFIRDLGLSKPIGYGLWQADFGVDDGHEHAFVTPAPWKRTVLHQYASRASIGDATHGDTDRSSAPELRPLLAHPTPNL